MAKDDLKNLPSIDKLLANASIAPLIEAHGREHVRNIARKVMAQARRAILSGAKIELAHMDGWAGKVQNAVNEFANPRVVKVINCSGVVAHTNLGRALLAEEAARAAYEAAISNVNLEYDLAAGSRGDRDDLTEDLIIELSGAQAATVVNNNAAALLLTLNTLAAGKEAIVSRGELIEIGGSFRLPEIMAKSGCILREVGTTNRTHLADYEEAVNENTGMILRAHSSNYRIIGFTTQPSDAELSGLAKSKKLPYVVDLGSGAAVDLALLGLPHEPTMRETLEAGADIVTVSGDKLLGGPQAGIIAGKEEYVALIRKNHLKRALRCGKMTLAALEATLRFYLNPETAVKRIPTLRHLARSLDDIRSCAERVTAILKARLGADAEVFLIDDISRAGSGSLPEMDIPTISVAVRHKEMGPNELAEWFRRQSPAVIGRVAGDLFRLDMRCVDYAEDFK